MALTTYPGLTNRKDGLPTGGSTGQVLTKISNSDFDSSWQDSTGGITGSLTATRIPYALNSTTLTDNAYLYYDSTNSVVESFSGLGSEKVTNGTFTGSATGWTVGSGWAYSSNTMTKNANGTGTLSQNISVVLGDEYYVSFVISSMTVSSVTVTLGGQTLGTITANGTYTYRVAPTSTANLVFTPTNTSRFTIDTVSVKALTGGAIATGSLGVGGANYAPSTTKMMMNFSHGNGSPGTTRAIQFNNASSYTYLDFYFGGVYKSSIGTDSSGGVSLYANGGNGVATYYGGGLSSYNTSTAFVHYNYGEFGAGVMAGTIAQPTSTLQSAGGTALKVKRITASQALDNTATHWLIDATTAAACSGTPTYSCSHWTNQTDCELRSSHGGGCSWYAGTDCSVYNYESGMTSCSGQAGCTVGTSSCAGPTDQTSCEAQDDSYGGSCTWNGNDCSVLDETTCGSTSGCTQNYSDCSTFNDDYSGCTGQSGCTSSSSTDCAAYDNTDQSTCEANTGCTWNGGDNTCSMTCSGTYYSSCSGTYYTCDGTYNTGSCTGTFGAACSGTSSCTGISNSTDCGNEAGCTWSSVLNATLPDLTAYPDRTYWIYNDSSGGADVALIPYSGQTINGTSSVTLANYKDGVHIAPFHQTDTCSGFNEGACTPSGCTKNYSNCTWDSMGATCSGNAVCTGLGDQTTCESTQYFSSCSGTYTVAKDWKIWSRT